jgi:hypothetical protein
MCFAYTGIRHTSLAAFQTSTCVQAALQAEEAKLPPLQSVVELTSAFLSPLEQGADAEVRGATRGMEELSHESAAGHLLHDGEGTLADGSTWKRVSGEEKGDNGYWCRCAAFACAVCLYGTLKKGPCKASFVYQSFIASLRTSASGPNSMSMDAVISSCVGHKMQRKYARERIGACRERIAGQSHSNLLLWKQSLRRVVLWLQQVVLAALALYMAKHNLRTRVFTHHTLVSAHHHHDAKFHARHGCAYPHPSKGSVICALQPLFWWAPFNCNVVAVLIVLSATLGFAGAFPVQFNLPCGGYMQMRSKRALRRRWVAQVVRCGCKMQVVGT